MYMWQKTIAAILVLCGAQGFGYALCQEMQCMLYHDTEQKQMLLYIIREISFLHRPMEEIFSNIGEKLQEPYRKVITDIAEEMGTECGRGLHAIWQENVSQMQQKKKYPKKAIEHMYKIGECLGCEEDDMQIASLTLISKELEEEIEDIKSRKEERSRLIQTLSLLAGVFCIVLFL